MKCVKKILLIFCCVSIINGCSILIEKIIPGVNQNEQEVKLSEKIDIEPASQEMVTKDTDQLVISQPEHTNFQTSEEIVSVDQLNSGERYSYNKSKETTEIPHVCTGENVTRHWRQLKKVVVVTDLLNIRSNYGSNQSVIGGARRCEQLLVIDKHVERIQGNKRIKSRGWLKIKTDKGIAGWVAGWHTRHIDN